MEKTKATYFISYTTRSEADKNWAKWIESIVRSRLNADTIMQEYDFRPGDNFRKRMHEALQRADYVLGVLTPTYMTSSNCADEWTNTKHFIPILCADFEPDGLLTSVVYIKLHDKEGEDAVQELIKGLQGTPRPTHELPFPGTGAAMADGSASHNTLNNLPDRNPYFTGRKNELRDLGKALSDHKTAALVGQGGFGKTQIAQEYAYRHWDEYGVIWQFDASSGTQIEAGYREFARVVLGMADAPMQPFDAIRPRIEHWLRAHHDYLFLFDNAEGCEQLGEYLPKGAHRGHALITSRTVVAVPGVHVEPIDVDTFTPGDALAFLRNRVGKGKVDKADGDKLAEALGFLPLALEQAAAYIKQKKYTLPGYMKLLEKHGLDVFAGKSHNPNYEKTVLTTWTITMEQLEPDARELMYMLAHCAPNDIPLQMFVKGHEHLPEALKSALWPEDALGQDALIEKLLRFALVKLKRDAWNRPLLSVHLLMQGVLRRGAGVLERCFAIAYITSRYRFDTKEGFSTFSQTWPHAVEIAEQAEEQWGENTNIQERAAFIYHATGYGLMQQGYYPEALKWHLKNMAIEVKVLGEEHPNTATTYNNIALVYDAQGNYPEAMKWHQKALVIREKVQGKEHPDTAATYHNMAGVYQIQGDYPAALAWYHKALAIREKTWGKERPETATTYNNMALVCQAQGDFPAALSWNQKALIIREKVLGKEHPDTATTYDNMAVVCRALGNHSKALKWHRKALAICEKVLGKEHPDTAAIYNNMAGAYKAQGDYPEALKWYQKALAIREKVLGLEHPSTATTYNNMAGGYHAQGNYPAALKWYQKALVIYENVFGKEHPSMATMYNNLAGVYADQSNYPAALAWHLKALVIREKVLGKEHPNTALTYNNIAEVYMAQNKPAVAAPLFKKAMYIFARKLGINHQYTQYALKTAYVAHAAAQIATPFEEWLAQPEP
jgi:tetratricopeptide (TPR) repeat protein